MNTMVRAIGYAALLVAFATGAAYTSCCPGLSWLAGLFTLPQDLQDNAQVAEALDRQAEALFQRLESRRQILDDVMTRRLGLIEAAARFRDLGDLKGEYYRQLFRRYYPGQTDEEKYCRQVIAFARFCSPCPQPPRIAELEAELEALLAREPIEGLIPGGLKPFPNSPSHDLPAASFTAFRSGT
jgi:hypothetical protein